MKLRVALPMGLALASAITGACALAQATESNWDAFAKNAAETCARIAQKAKDVKVFDYCVVEIMRPLVRGPSCTAFVGAMSDAGYQCDDKGMLYYEVPEANSSAPMTKEQFADALGKIASKYARKTLAICMLASKSNEDVAPCWKKGENKLKEIYMACANTKFNGSDAQMVRGFDHCMEYKLKLPAAQQ